jgi:hypothetical protein
MNRHCTASGGVLALAALITLAGCGGPAGVSVDGLVTLDGAPLADALLEFAPADAGAALGGASARTDAQGKFQVASSPQLRLLPGTYGVRVSKWVDKKSKQTVPAGDVEQLKLANLALNVLPYRYSNPGANAPVQVDLKPGSNANVKIEVVSK